MTYRWTAALLASGLAAFAAAASAAPAGDAAAGKVVFSEQCAFCHSTVSTGGGAAGPDLNGVVGRKPGALAGFTFTSALKAKTAGWTPELLDNYLKDPQAFASGSAMPVNLADAKQRTDVIAYLATLK